MAEIIIPLGKDAILYYGSPGSIASTGQVKGVRDLTVTLDKDVTEATRRITGAFEDARQSIKRLKLAFDLANVISDNGDEADVVETLRATYFTDTYDGDLTNTGIAFYAKSKAAGGSGPEGDFIITKFDRTETHGDIQMYAVEAAMTQVHGRTPTWSVA